MVPAALHVGCETDGCFLKLDPCRRAAERSPAEQAVIVTDEIRRKPRGVRVPIAALGRAIACLRRGVCECVQSSLAGLVARDWEIGRASCRERVSIDV